jgi:hypothetical protein
VTASATKLLVLTSCQSAPVEPFGGTDDFAVSDTALVYTAKDSELLEAAHTKQNIYIVDLKDGSKPKELTSGKQGATHAPAFSHAGDKVAWLELAKDGYESDQWVAARTASGCSLNRLPVPRSSYTTSPRMSASLSRSSGTARRVRFT